METLKFHMHYLRGRILKSDILSNEILSFHNGTSTTKCPSSNHPSWLKQKPTTIQKKNKKQINHHLHILANPNQWNN